MKIQNIKPAKAKKLVKQILFSAAVFLFSLNSCAADYYWVGGSGSWDDYANHWATASGGTVFYTQIPTLNDNVYFDANSFPSSGDTVSLVSGTTYYCHNADWTNAANHPTIYNGELRVNGNLTLIPNMNFSSNLSLMGGNFDPAGHTFSYLNFYFGQVSLLNDLTCNGLHFYRGGLITNNHTLTINYDFTTSGQLDILSFDFGSSTINCQTFYCYSGTSSLDINIAGNATVNAAVNFNVSAGSFNRVTTPTFGALNWDSPTGNYNSIVSKYIGCFDCNIDTAITSYFNSGTGFGASVNKLIITYDSTVVNSPNIDGKNIIGSATISGAQCNISGNTPFDSLSFYNSPGLIIAEGDTVTIHNYFFKDNSQALFNLRSSNVSLPAFLKSPLNLCLDSMKIENIHASGNIPFHAGTNSIDLGGNTGWSFSNCATIAGYYWVGGTGNWSDYANHWATTSGGTTFHSTFPSPSDDVYFDANSFLTMNDTLYIDQTTIYFKNMDWSGIIYNPIISCSGTYDLDIYGSLILSSNVAWPIAGTFSFKATSPGNIIKTGKSVFPQNSHLYFDGSGEWTLIDSLLTAGNISLINGSFISNNNYIEAYDISLFGPAANLSVDFGSSEIHCHDGGASSTLGTFNFSACAIYCNTWGSSYPYTYDKIYCLGTSHIDSASINFFRGSLEGENNFINTAIITQEIIWPTLKPNIFIKATLAGSASGTYLINSKCIFDTLLLFDAGSSVYLYDTLTINSLLAANPSISIIGDNTGVTRIVAPSSATVCLDYDYLQYLNATGGATFYAGANSIDVGGNSGWQFTSCMAITNVWPGDANYDLTANNVDVLNIGLAYGDTGAVRAGASNNWVAQPATNWSGFFQSAVNKKHADCDGNGVVDNNDTLAISLNYGLTHPARLVGPNSNQSTSPPLYLIANPDTVMEGDTVEVDIYLGTQLIPVDSIYGIAFTINFDTALVDTSWMPFDFTGSWMGTPGVDLLAYDKKLFSQGKADVALTRTDHANIDGYGYLGKMGAVIVDNVGTRLTTSPPYVTLPLSISNVTALTATEFYLTISTGNESVEIDTLGITGIHSSPDANSPFSVYPNPVHKKLNVFSYWLKGETNCTVEFYNVFGGKIISQQVPVSQNRFTTDVSTVPQGMYCMKVITAKGTVNKKILVIKK